MRSGYVVSPEHILYRALSCGLVTLDEAESMKFRNAALNAAEELSGHWPEGEGFGSSDMTFVLEGFLRDAGVETEYRDNRLCRKEPKSVVLADYELSSELLPHRKGA